MSEKSKKERKIQEIMPSAEEVQKELAKAKSMDDFFGKEGIFARLFAKTIETMLESELSEELGYEPYEAKGKNSGNSRNGHYPKKVRTSTGETTIQVPRDRNGEYEPQVVKKHVANTNELEDKIIAMYAKERSVRDIQETLKELYGVDVSPTTLSAITDKVWELVEAWQNRPLANIYPIIYLDAIHTASGYSCRWVVEMFHRILKSGCRIEHRQFDDLNNLKRFLAIDSVVAWRVLYLTLISRTSPQRSCAPLLEVYEWQALYCFIHKTNQPPAQPPTLGDAALWIARLGGFTGSQNIQPGTTVFWKGLQRLTDIAQAWLVFHPDT